MCLFLVFQIALIKYIENINYFFVGFCAAKPSFAVFFSSST